MRKLDMLREQAERSAEHRGHALGPWKPNLVFRAGPRKVELSICVYCGEWAEVDTCPLPRGINVSGTAVAVECNKQLP